MKTNACRTWFQPRVPCWLAAAGLVAVCSLCSGCIRIPRIVLPHYGNYTVDSDPQGAHVFKQDGTYEGVTPTSVTLRTSGSFNGEYSIRLVKRGYREKVYNWMARCDQLSEMAARRASHQLMVFLEEELQPADIVLPPLPPEKRTTLAVIDFDVGKEVSDDTGSAAADLCREALAGTQQYKLMDRNHVRSVLGEQDFAAAVRCDSTQCIVQYGKLLHVRRMVHGRIVQLGDEYSLHIGMTDVNTSELLSQVTAVVPQDLKELRDIVPIKVYELVADTLQNH